MALARMTMVFQAAKGAQFSDEDAMRYGQFLHDNLGLGERIVSTDDVLAAAEPEDSPLHDAFTWDDSEAAHEYRLQQARQLVSHIVITREIEGDLEVPVRAFHNVTEMTPDGVRSGYISERVVWERPDLATQVKGRALRELRGWRDRYATYESLAWAAERVGAIADEMEEVSA